MKRSRKISELEIADWHAHYDRGLLNYDNCTKEELRVLAVQRGIPAPAKKTRAEKEAFLRLLHHADDSCTFTKLFNLSPEIRILVYEQCCACFSQEPLIMPTEPPLASICRSPRGEFLPVFYNQCSFRVDLEGAHSRCRPKMETALFFGRLQPSFMARIRKLLIRIRDEDEDGPPDEELAQIERSKDGEGYNLILLPYRNQYVDDDGLPSAAKSIVEQGLRAVMNKVITRTEAAGQFTSTDVYRLSWAMQDIWKHEALQLFVLDDS
nr:hypothetical protein B0A51_11532 [Rachicladosporium sp. CCFEE 5018]